MTTERLRIKEFKIVDTHAHMCDHAFDNDRAEVLARAKSAGICTIITVSENLENVKRNIELAEKYPELRPAAGLYPAFLDLSKAEELIFFIRRERPRLFAIGEVGLDFWVVKEEEKKTLQREIFKRFVHLACELDLPLNVHSRSAGRHAVALLLEQGARKVQLHAFDGKAAAALPAVETGYFFSIPPSVVRSRQKQKLLKQLPLSCLLIETDSPVLGASAKNRNEPANALIALNAISQIKDISKDEVYEVISDNTRRLYGDI